MSTIGKQLHVFVMVKVWGDHQYLKNNLSIFELVTYEVHRNLYGEKSQELQIPYGTLQNPIETIENVFLQTAVISSLSDEDTSHDF